MEAGQLQLRSGQLHYMLFRRSPPSGSNHSPMQITEWQIPPRLCLLPAMELCCDPLIQSGANKLV